MRMLLNISVPHEPFNAYVRDGSISAKMGRILEALRPEAVYFTSSTGGRGAIIIVDVADPSRVPSIAEPWFLLFNAQVQFQICMTPDDLRKSGLDDLGRKWGS